MLRIDHIGLAARDAQASARALAEILGAPEPTVDGADDDMFRVETEGSFLLFSVASEVHSEHIAFRVDASRFDAIVTRLRARGIAFGNDPENPRNGATDDPLGGAGRVYWTDDDGHLFEATC
jgi:catechol 2,3-dioxygenase-like lactoylglutathione lyase family enzyme